MVVRKTAAQHTIDTLTYKSERQFPFEKYITKLAEAFDILEENDLPKAEREKVTIILLRGILTENHHLEEAAKSGVVMNRDLRSNFTAACNQLSEVMGTLSYGIHSQSGRLPARNVASAGSFRGGGRGMR